MKTLYVHIGTPKTATTSIQEFCYDNADVLKSKNYCYPIFPFKYRNKNFRRNGVFLANRYLDKDYQRLKDEEERRFIQGMDTVIELFNSYDNIILSDEGIWWNMHKYKKSLWKDLKVYADKYNFTIKVIVYLRRQDDYIVSYYNQRVKALTSLLDRKEFTFEEFLSKYKTRTHVDYYESLEKISKVIGKENVIVKRYAGLGNKKPIQCDFLEAIGLEFTDEFLIVTDHENLNTRLNENHMEIKRIINQNEDFSIQETYFLRDALLSATAQSTCTQKFNMFSKEESIAFVKQFEEGNRKVAEEYIKDGKPLFSDEYSNKDKWNRDNAFFVDDILTFVSTSDIELLRLIKQQQLLIQEQNKQLISQNAKLLKLENKTKKLNDELKSTNKLINNFRYNVKHPIRTLIKIIIRKLKSI